MNTGEILEVLATDKGALSDIPAWANAGGHTIVEQKTEDEVIYFYIQKHNENQIASSSAYSLF